MTDLDNSNFVKDEITLKDFLSNVKSWILYLRLKGFAIALSIVIGSVIGLAYSIYEKPIYTATLTFAMEEDKSSGNSGISGALGLASSFGIDLGSANAGGAFAATNLSELMKSRLIVEKALFTPVRINNQNISLIEYYIRINKIRDKWKNSSSLKNIYFLPNSTRPGFSFQQDSILKQIHLKLIRKDNLNISQKDKKVTIITIEVKSEDELFAKLFCENLAKETSDFYVETKSKKARINVDVLQKQVDSIKSALNSSITGVAAEVDNIYNLNPAFNIKGAVSKRKQVDVQANTSILSNLVVQLELAKITLRKETPLIQLIDMPILPLDKDKLSKSQSIILFSILSAFVFISWITIKKIYLKFI